MTLAGEYAYAGRDAVVDKVLEILGAESTYEVHNHHNFAWREKPRRHRRVGRPQGLHPAFPGQEGFVGATMGEPSVILRGVESGRDSATLLYSTVHGAGRVMSRTQAAGKSRKRWACNNRDCDWFAGTGRAQARGRQVPDVRHDGLGKRMVHSRRARSTGRP
jgi:tRNA-splicing ligase RtcB